MQRKEDRVAADGDGGGSGSPVDFGCMRLEHSDTAHLSLHCERYMTFDQYREVRTAQLSGGQPPVFMRLAPDYLVVRKVSMNLDTALLAIHCTHQAISYTRRTIADRTSKTLVKV